MTFAEKEIVAAHEHCFDNAGEIKASELCVCYFCVAHDLSPGYFPPDAIVKWLNPKVGSGPAPLTDSATAFCPNCHFDMVIGDASGVPIRDRNFVTAINDRF